jgi:peptidoglycan biosynthesis protein MviN/MurJ (putative lipid II flippase)
MIANIILAYVLYNLISTPGLAIAAVCGSLVNAVLNYICMVRKYPGMFKRADGIAVLKTVIAAVIMFGVLWLVFGAVKNVFDVSSVFGSLMAAAVTGGAGVIVYLVLCIVLKIDVVMNVINNFKGGKKA